jgi:tape measure domain-containing protein
MVADSSIIIDIRQKGNGAQTIKRDLDEIARSSDKTFKSISTLDTAFEKTSRRVQLAEARLKDLALAGQTNTERFKRLKAQTDQYKETLREAEKQVVKTNRGFKGMLSSVNLLRASFTALFATLGLGHFSRLSDTITNIETRLKNVTGGVDEFNKRFDELFRIAQRTGDSFEDVVDNFVRLNTSLPDSIRNVTDLTKVTELLSRGFAASGANAQVASSVLTQLTQGLAGNFANASQELNSLVEGTPLLAKIIAEELGGRAATDLKKFAQEGKLTTESFLQAVLASEQAIKSYEIPPTIGRSVQKIRNEIIRLGSESDGLKVLSGALAKALDGLANNIDKVLKVATVLAITTLPLLVKSFAVTLPAALGFTATAFNLLTAAMAANPIGAIAVAITASISTLIVFREEITNTLKGIEFFGINAADFFNNLVRAIKIGFSSVAATIAGVFSGVTNIAKKAIAEAEILLFKFTDNKLVRKLGIDTYTPSIGALRRNNQSVSEAFREGFNNSPLDGFFESILADEFSTGIVTGSSGGITSLNSDLDTTETKISEINDKIGKETPEVFKDVSKSVKESFGEAFDGIFGDFENWITDLKGSFSGFLRNIATQAARPIVMNIVAGVSGAAGGLSLGSLVGGGSSSSGGGIGGLGSILSAGKNLLNGGFSNSLAGIGNGIGNVLSGQSFNFVGPTKLGGIVGGSFGNLGLGAIGGLGANLLGLGSGNALIDGGLSTAGSIIGGMILPGIGNIVGGFLGGAVGGLFGGSTPSGAISAYVGLDNGRLTPSTFNQDESSSKAQELFRNLQSTISDQVNSILDSIGGSIEQIPTIRLSTSQKRDRGRIRVGIGASSFGRAESQGTAFTNAQDAVDFAISNIIGNSSISGLSEGVLDVLKQSSLGGSSAEQIISDVNLAKIAFGEDTDKNQLIKSLQELNDQFDLLRDRAIELGLPLENVNIELEKQKEALLSPIFGGLQNFLDSQILSNVSSSNPIEKLSLARSAFDENLAAINSGDLSNLGNITNQASTLLSLGRDTFASGSGFGALEAYVRQSIAGIDESLGVGGQVTDDVVRQITVSGARQASLAEQTNALIEELLEENRKMRQELQRQGNLVAVL